MNRTLLAIAVSAILATARGDPGDDDPAPLDDSSAPSAEVPSRSSTP